MRWNKFLENIQSDLKLFAFILAVLCLYRISFMFIMNGYMEADSGTSDILLANWAGLRLSLKTAGIVMALSVILGTLPQLIFNRLPQRIIGKAGYRYVICIYIFGTVSGQISLLSGISYELWNADIAGP